MEYDFKRMRNQTVDFAEQWNIWQDKVLKTYMHLFREISSGNVIPEYSKLFIANTFSSIGFIRALAIIRAKNPTRGAKRVRDDGTAKESAMDNPLKGLIKWIKVNNNSNRCLKETDMSTILEGTSFTFIN